MEEKGYFVLTVPLKMELWQKHWIEKKFRISEIFYNNLQKIVEQEYKELIHSSGWILLETEIRKIRNEERNDCTESEKVCLKQRLENCYKSQRKMLNEAHLTEYSLQHLANQLRKQERYKSIDSTLSYAIGKQCYQSFRQLVFENGEKIHFKKKGSLNSIANVQNNSGLRIVKIDSEYYCKWGKKFTARLLVDWYNPYEKAAFKNKIKYCRIKKIEKRNVIHYYCQITFEGDLPKKVKQTKIRYDIGEGPLNIIINVDEVQVYTKSFNQRYSLMINSKTISSKINTITAKMERSKRINNPENYNRNKKVKRKKYMEWNYSKRYMKLRAQRRNYYRIIQCQRKIHYNNLVNEILALDNSFLIQKNYTNKNDIKRKRLDGSFNSPSDFFEILIKKGKNYSCEMKII